MLDSPSLRWRPAAPLVGFKRQRTLDHYRTPNATPPTPVVDPARRTVVSVYDGDGSALAPWAERGYRCVSLAGFLQLRDTDLVDVAFACASPPSRDLSVAGARHWKRKREKDPHFQDKAVALVKEIRDVFEAWRCTMGPSVAIAVSPLALDARCEELATARLVRHTGGGPRRGDVALFVTAWNSTHLRRWCLL